MLNELLKNTWDQMMDSEYFYKSNIQKHVIQMDGSELGDERSSMILIYYNVYTQTPMICIYHVNGDVDFEPEKVNGFRAVKETGTDEDGNQYTEYVYLEDAMREALS